MRIIFNLPKLRFIAAAALTVLAALVVSAQVLKPSSNSTNEMLQLQRMPGRLLVQGSNREPAGELNLRSYVLEELTLQHPVRAEVNGLAVETTRAWRLSVTGGPFVVRAMPAMVWIDDKLAGFGAESADLSRVSVVFFDQALLKEGATISVSYGQNDPQRVELPEKLKLGSAK